MMLQSDEFRTFGEVRFGRVYSAECEPREIMGETRGERKRKIKQSNSRTNLTSVERGW